MTGTSQCGGKHHLLSCTPWSCQPPPVALPVQKRRHVESQSPSFSPHPSAKCTVDSLPTGFPSPVSLPSPILTSLYTRTRSLHRPGGGKTWAHHTSVTPARLTSQESSSQPSGWLQGQERVSCAVSQVLLPFSPPPGTLRGSCSMKDWGVRGWDWETASAPSLPSGDQTLCAPFCPLLGLSLLPLLAFGPTERELTALRPFPLPGAKESSSSPCSESEPSHLRIAEEWVRERWGS